jgi:protein involved in polysaccharide export with SLBB domain
MIAVRHDVVLAALMLALSLLSGCYAPLHSPGIEARKLPDSYRAPMRTAGLPLNYASLVLPPPPVYLLGPGDLLEVTVPDLIEMGRAEPLQTSVLETGEIQVPRLGLIHVAGLSVAQAQAKLVDALAHGILVDPSVTLTLVQKGTVNVLVLGAVTKPGVQALPRYESDVGHAIAAAGGLAEEAGDSIEIHRRTSPVMPAPGVGLPAFGPDPAAPLQSAATEPAREATRSPAAVFHASHSVSQTQAVAVVPAAFAPPAVTGFPPGQWHEPTVYVDPIVRIPLRGADPASIQSDTVALGPGDVVVVPHRTQQVFYVVGKLSEVNRTRFTVGDRDREIGNGFVLPPDREIDVVTAVAMAGYIDPIESPTTVTVHRTQPDGRPLLIHVDLIRARVDARENVLIQAGDIVYLNPDCWWYSRRMFDRIIGGALDSALGSWLSR